MSMRELSTRMIEAVLEGNGLQGVAELAASEAGGSVAIVLPGRGLAARAPTGGELSGLVSIGPREGAHRPRPPDLPRTASASGWTSGLPDPGAGCRRSYAAAGSGASVSSIVSAGAFWRLDRASDGTANAEIAAESRYEDG
jgi:hypothetical protein